MYFSNDFLLFLYEKMQALYTGDDIDAQGGTQYCSEIKYLIALDKFIKKNSKNLDYSNNDEKKEFCEYVGDVVLLGTKTSSVYTKNFSKNIGKYSDNPDFNVGSNFFSTNICATAKKAPSNTYTWPSRDAILLQIKYPEISVESNGYKNFYESYLSSSLEKCAILLAWLFRFESFSSVENLTKSVVSYISNNYTASFCSSVGLSEPTLETKLANLFSTITTSDTHPEIEQYGESLSSAEDAVDNNKDESNTEGEYSIEEGDNVVGESFVINWKQSIFYGVPGCGKSYSIDKRLTELGITSESRESHTKRVVFHPEFTNADFVGQILPTLTEKGVEYKFNAGQFTKILRDAYTHPSESYALIIEEINRGNAASIFGDLFQLLDRLDEDEKDGEYTQGWSSYCVMNDYINAYMRGVYDNKDEENPPIALLIKNANIGIRLPPNLSIFATMNTSDQNVFKLDNAFKRRWELEMIPNEFDFTCDDEEEQKKNFNQCNAPIEGFDDFSWGGFRSAVNAFITDPINGDDTNSFSDKQLGTWFVKAKASDESETGYIISKKIFLNKVIEYLWDDVFTSDFTIFNSDIKTLSRAIEIGNSSIFSSVFVETVKQKSAELGDLQAVDSELTKAERVIKPRYEMTPYLEHIQSFIQEKHPNFELNLNNKQFIGVKEKGKDNNLDGNNFVYFKIVKTKGIFKFCFNVKKSDTILSSLNENFEGRFESERATKTTIRYKIDLKLDDVAEFQKYKEILTSYMEESYNHYYGSAN